MTPKTRVLTGITTTGSPHIGNYVGAIRPAIAASRTRDVESYFFLADYHALVKCQEPERVQRSTLEIAATWLACGLDPGKVFFYRQSDIVEIPELTWLLTCTASKGLLNRAHAYKAAVDQNTAAGEDPDAGITMGLFNYPVLMAADILMFNAHEVPVGRDQIQHIEMARDIGQRFNHLFGREYFTLPEARVDESTAVLPGLDGRKMSKSYDNTIPLWLSAKELKKAVLGIVTNSLAPGEPKDPDGSHLFTIYQAFASAEETTAFRHALVEGLGWGDAKQRLFERIDGELREARSRYEALMAEPERIEQILRAGASRAREKSSPFMGVLRNAVGLRSLDQGVSAPVRAKRKPQAGSRLLTYREKDGSFHFKLVGADGGTVFTSRAFTAPDVARAEQDALLALAPEELRTNALPGHPHDTGFRFVLRRADGAEIAYGAAHAAASDSLAAFERALSEIDAVRAAKSAGD